MGYTVAVEEPVNGYTDLIAERHGEGRIPIEVETGKSDWRANVNKNLRKGFPFVLLAVTNEEALNPMHKSIQAEYPNDGAVSALLAWELIERSKERLLDR